LRRSHRRSPRLLAHWAGSGVSVAGRRPREGV
jgi:hypothetical protein